MTDINWDSAPKDATHYAQYKGRSDWKYWLTDEGYYFIRVDGAMVYNDFNDTSLVNSVGHDKDVFIILDSRTTEWSGKGLPPVGTKCLCFFRDDDLNILWLSGEILKHHENGHSCAVFLVEPHNDKNLYWSADFKPLDTRSNEQKAYQDIINTVCGEHSSEVITRKVLDAIKAGKIHNVTFKE